MLQPKEVENHSGLTTYPEHQVQESRLLSLWLVGEQAAEVRDVPGRVCCVVRDEGLVLQQVEQAAEVIAGVLRGGVCYSIGF